MPKNTVGGKKFKKMKHGMDFQRPLDLPEDDQQFALVNKLMGNGRATVTFVTDSGEVSNNMGIICGKLRKRKQWVIAGNFVVISIREFEKEKVDIIHVYKEHEMNELKRKSLINQKLIKLSNSYGPDIKKKMNELHDEEFAEFVEDDSSYIKSKDTRKNKEVKPRGNNISIQDFGIISSEEEDDDTEIKDI